MLSDLTDEIAKRDHDVFIYRFIAVDDNSKKLSASYSHFPSGTVFEGKNKESIYQKLLRGAFHSLWIKAIKAELLKSDTTDFKVLSYLFYAEDLVMSLYPLSKAQSICYIDMPYYFYRQNPSSIVKVFNPKKLDNIEVAYRILHEYVNSWEITGDKEQLFGDSYVSAAITIFNSAIFTGIPYRLFKGLIAQSMRSDGLLKQRIMKYRSPVGSDKLIKLFPFIAWCIRKRMVGFYYYGIRTLVSISRFFNR
jgi:hypothetical protein